MNTGPTALDSSPPAVTPGAYYKRLAVWLFGTLAAAAISVALVRLVPANFRLPSHEVEPFLVFMAIVILLGFGGSGIALLVSPFIIKSVFKIRIITKETAKTEHELALVHSVEELAQRAGLPAVPQVGVYSSDSFNAFASGFSRRHSMVAFTSTIVEKFDQRMLTAVAAHEVAHVANGDMIILTLIQGVINSIILAIMLPFRFFQFLAWLASDGSTAHFLINLIAAIALAIAQYVLVFLGTLVVNTFSRDREFRADKMASEIYEPQAMINALQALGSAPTALSSETSQYRAMMIASPAAILDIFSTHPAIARRVSALSQNAPVRNNFTTTSHVPATAPAEQATLPSTDQPLTPTAVPASTVSPADPIASPTAIPAPEHPIQAAVAPAQSPNAASTTPSPVINPNTVLIGSVVSGVSLLFLCLPPFGLIISGIGAWRIHLGSQLESKPTYFKTSVTASRALVVLHAVVTVIVLIRLLLV